MSIFVFLIADSSSWKINLNSQINYFAQHLVIWRMCDLFLFRFKQGQKPSARGNRLHRNTLGRARCVRPNFAVWEGVSLFFNPGLWQAPRGARGCPESLLSFQHLTVLVDTQPAQATILFWAGTGCEGWGWSSWLWDGVDGVWPMYKSVKPRTIHIPH